MKKIVLALGGNALGNTPLEQQKAVKIAAKSIVKLSEKGFQVLICHGNGPQVGMINDSFVESQKQKVVDFAMPFPEAGAMSQGYIGYHLQNAVNEELVRVGSKTNVATIITQTIVDKNDPAFKNFTKPIGAFMSESEAKKFAEDNGYTVKEDSGRGWRRVVASPIPTSIQEINSINTLLENNTIVIAGGGGGIPVYKDGNALVGVPAVIDKDFTSAKIAELIKAESFIVLTAVDQIKINYGKPNEESIAEANIETLMKYIGEEQFAPGSMLPKVKAAMSFVEKTNSSAYIGELSDSDKIIEGKAGTRIFLK